MKNVLFSICLLLTFIACEKDNATPMEEIREGNYVSMNTPDGEKIFEEEVTWNSYYLNNGQLSIVMPDSLGFNLAIHITHPDLLNENFPSDLDGINNRRGGIQFINRNIFVNPLFGEFDSINYSASTPNDINIKLKSFNNDVIEGEFSGTLSTRTGKEFEISDGFFKTEIIIE